MNSDTLHRDNPQTLLRTESISRDSIPRDSIPKDTLPARLAIIVEKPADPPSPPPHSDSGSSWIIALLMLLFCIIAFRMRSSSRFLAAMISDLTEIRERHSIFDTTVRETSLMTLLCLMTIFSGGILIESSLRYLSPLMGNVTPLPPLTENLTPLLYGYLTSTLVMGLYMLLLWGTYRVVGYVFAGDRKARMWTQAFGASMALIAPLWLPAALVCLCKPEWSAAMLIFAAAVFIFVKLTFIWKSFRIFFIKASSWVLFLYYLCSLEVVPIILAFAAALKTTPFSC